MNSILKLANLIRKIYYELSESDSILLQQQVLDIKDVSKQGMLNNSRPFINHENCNICLWSSSNHVLDKLRISISIKNFKWYWEVSNSHLSTSFVSSLFLSKVLIRNFSCSDLLWPLYFWTRRSTVAIYQISHGQEAQYLDWSSQHPFWIRIWNRTTKQCI